MMGLDFLGSALRLGPVTGVDAVRTRQRQRPNWRGWRAALVRRGDRVALTQAYAASRQRAKTSMPSPDLAGRHRREAHQQAGAIRRREVVRARSDAGPGRALRACAMKASPSAAVLSAQPHDEVHARARVGDLQPPVAAGAQALAAAPRGAPAACASMRRRWRSKPPSAMKLRQRRLLDRRASRNRPPTWRRRSRRAAPAA